ncbi:uncharacterized protein LOC122267551 [Penaeus japonicus]|uniref:uncharacterized protein LOC122267551 n=1 Tax=Penaeus japonicus TaxID=27405 RepID=UPI001C70B8C2|nr:uncharacterized protein LOC122267551 [Penaeus japonicus]
MVFLPRPSLCKFSTGSLHYSAWACLLTLAWVYVILQYSGAVLTRVAEEEPALSDFSRRCSPQQHVMFLKTHKCGSSTVQNVFMRYGISQNLSFGIPLQDRGFNNKEKFMASMIPEELLPPDGKVEIFAVHSRLNVGEHRLVLHNDTSWITIVREPASVFESLYNFYGIKSWYGRDVTELKDIPMQNVFMRYGISQNLSFGIPLQDRGFNSKEKFMASMIPEELLPPDGKVEIFAVHSRLNVGEHRLVLHNDTSWITIVREPASVFESLYNFYDIKSWYGRDVTELQDIPMKVRGSCVWFSWLGLMVVSSYWKLSN